MTKKNTVPVTVHILDKEYKISCPADDREALIKAATYLSDKMRDVRDNGRLIGLDRIAVMAALNITHEMFQQQSGNGGSAVSGQLSHRLRHMQDKVEAALSAGRQMEL